MFHLEMSKLFDLILSLQKYESDTISFPQHMVDELGRYFPSSTVAFHPGSLYDLLAARRGFVVEKPKYFLPVIFNQKNLNEQNNNEKIQEYADYYYMTDVKQLPNLPMSLRGKTVLRFSDVMPEEEFKHSEMYYYLKSCDLLNNATIYLYDSNVCLGGVSFLRSQERGVYTQEELTFMEFLGKYISQLYVDSIKESFYADVANIYRTNQDAEDIGMAIMTSKFDVIEANTTVLEFCNHILENAPEFHGILFRKSSSISDVARAVATHTHGSHELKHEIHIGNLCYTCTLRPIMMRSPAMDLWSLYVFQIYRTQVQDTLINEASVQEYPLTERERVIAELIAKGFNTTQISKELFISPNTVKNHVSNLFHKVKVKNRIELINKLTSSRNNNLLR